MHTELLSENIKIRALVKDLDTDEKIILKWLIKKQDTRVQVVAHDRECWWNVVNTVTNQLSSVTSKRFVEQRSNRYFLYTDEFLKWKKYWMLQTEVTNVNKTVISCYTPMFCTIRHLQKFNKYCFELYLKWYGPNWILNWTTFEVIWTKLNSELNYIWSDMDQTEFWIEPHLK